MSKIIVIGSMNMDLVAVAPRLPLAGETLMTRNSSISPVARGRTRPLPRQSWAAMWPCWVAWARMTMGGGCSQTWPQPAAISIASGP